MTVQHLNQLVQNGADARFDEVIERLLFILEYPPFLSEPKALVWKWSRTGLLDGLNGSAQQELAEKLEAEARLIIDWMVLENPNEDAFEEAVKRFGKLREETIVDYECQRHYFRNQTFSGCPIR